MKKLGRSDRCRLQSVNCTQVLKMAKGKISHCVLVVVALDFLCEGTRVLGGLGGGTFGGGGTVVACKFSMTAVTSGSSLLMLLLPEARKKKEGERISIFTSASLASFRLILPDTLRPQTDYCFSSKLKFSAAQETF